MAIAKGLPFARISATIERTNAFPDDPMQLRGGWAVDIDELWDMAGHGPKDIDVLQTYDDYPVICMMQFEDLGFCAKGEGPEFVRKHDLIIGGDFPHNTSGSYRLVRLVRRVGIWVWLKRSAKSRARQGRRKSRARNVRLFLGSGSSTMIAGCALPLP
jgi:hypothetical protein